MYKYLGFFLCFIFLSSEAKLPDLVPQDVTEKTKEIMKGHASCKTLSPLLIQRILNNYVENLDPNKTYFLEEDIKEWLYPSEQLLSQIITDYNEHNFRTFEVIHDTFIQAIKRRHLLEKEIDYKNLPTHIHSEEFKDMPWTKSLRELSDRLKRIRALQQETAAKLSEEMREKSMQRIAKRQAKYEEEIMVSLPQERQCLILSQVLKAMTSALDAHTVYFTPDEAAQFMIHVQQRLYGIGAQLRDDINGFTVVKIVEGGPAAINKQLKVKDRIIAVNGEPVVGMDIADAVDLIRGEANTPVILTIIREIKASNNEREEKLDISILRGEVVLKETRFKASHQPFGEKSIGYLKLYSFYQDRDSSSASDLLQAIEDLKKNHQLEGLILDLRYNSGGLLTQAVAVTGLFIKKGIVVSIKDENGDVQHLRNLEEITAWDGPLIVLVNRMSASASEIVAQTLQDYGRAIIIGDDQTFGKGSYQTFTLSATDSEQINPQGEYKVTRGRYYTVSGKTPQLIGVLPDIEIPGPLSQTNIGERFAKYPLESDQIKPNFEDDLSDISFLQRDKIRKLYKFNLEKKKVIYLPFLEKLKNNSILRLEKNQNYQNMLNFIKKRNFSTSSLLQNSKNFDLLNFSIINKDPFLERIKEKIPQNAFYSLKKIEKYLAYQNMLKKHYNENLEELENIGQNDLQLEEAFNIMKDLLILEMSYDF